MDYIIKNADCGLNLEYMIAKDDILIFRCFKCKKNCEIDFDKELINKFLSVYDFCKGDINKFIFLLRKGFIPMNICIIGIDLMKYHYLIRKIFTVA